MSTRGHIQEAHEASACTPRPARQRHAHAHSPCARAATRTIRLRALSRGRGRGHSPAATGTHMPTESWHQTPDLEGGGAPGGAPEMNGECRPEGGALRAGGERNPLAMASVVQNTTGQCSHRPPARHVGASDQRSGSDTFESLETTDAELPDYSDTEDGERPATLARGEAHAPSGRSAEGTRTCPRAGDAMPPGREPMEVTTSPSQSEGEESDGKHTRSPSPMPAGGAQACRPEQGHSDAHSPCN